MRVRVWRQLVIMCFCVVRFPSIVSVCALHFTPAVRLRSPRCRRRHRDGPFQVTSVELENVVYISPHLCMSEDEPVHIYVSYEVIQSNKQKIKDLSETDSLHSRLSSTSNPRKYMIE